MRAADKCNVQEDPLCKSPFKASENGEQANGRQRASDPSLSLFSLRPLPLHQETYVGVDRQYKSVSKGVWFSGASWIVDPVHQERASSSPT